jgi:hypothetical protein
MHYLISLYPASNILNTTYSFIMPQLTYSGECASICTKYRLMKQPNRLIVTID